MEKKRYILLSICVILFAANYNQIFKDCIIQNDYYFVSLFKNKSLIEILTFGSERALFISTIPNNLIFATISPHSVIAARLTILVIGMIPVSFLFFWILRYCFKLPSLPALYTAVLPHVIPGQNLIPIFINGSYQTYALIPSLIFFIISFYYIEEDRGRPWLLLSSGFLTLSFFSSELSLFFCIPIFSYFFLRFGKRRSLYRLCSAAFVLILLRVVIFQFQTKSIANIVVLSQTFKTRFSQWAKSFYLGFDFINPHIIVYMLLGSAVISIVSLLVTKLFSKNRGTLENNGTDWLTIIVYAVLFMISAGIPYIFLSDHPFSSRYGYPAAFGFALLLVALPYQVIGKKKFAAKYLNIIFLLIVLWCSYQKLESTNETYAPVEHLTKKLVLELSGREYPKDSQIVLTGRELTILRTASVLPWSTGFLKYFLERDDLSGIIGAPRSFYDPFKKWSGSWDNKMTGISVDKPLFVYDFDSKNRVLISRKYILQWLGEHEAKPWIIYSADEESGRVSPYASGFGMQEYQDTIAVMETRGIRTEEIYGSGEGIQGIAHAAFKR